MDLSSARENRVSTGIPLPFIVFILAFLTFLFLPISLSIFLALSFSFSLSLSLSIIYVSPVLHGDSKLTPREPAVRTDKPIQPYGKHGSSLSNVRDDIPKVRGGISAFRVKQTVSQLVVISTVVCNTK